MENNKKKNIPAKFREGEDFYYKDGLMVLTGKYLLERGYCCENGCKHCPYGFRKDKKVGS